MAWAYAKLAHYHSDLLAAVADAAAGEAGELSVQHILNILWAAATLNWPASRMASTLAGELLRRINEGLEEMLPQHLANLLWATAVTDVLDRRLWDASLGKLKSSDVPYTELAEEATTQIFQARMLIMARHPDEEWPMDPELLERGLETWKAAVSKVT